MSNDFVLTESQFKDIFRMIRGGAMTLPDYEMEWMYSFDEIVRYIKENMMSEYPETKRALSYEEFMSTPAAELRKMLEPYPETINRKTGDIPELHFEA